MSYNQYPPPPPQQGYPQPQQQPQAPEQGYGQAQGGYSTPYVDTRTVIGGWSASQYNMQPGKHIEYKVYSKPTQKGGVWKTVQFFKPYQKKNGTIGEGHDFSFNMMKELVEKINHFINNFCEEKGYFVWQQAGLGTMQGQPQYPQQPYPQQPPAPMPMQPSQYVQQPAYPQPQQPQVQGQYPPPPPKGPWP